MQEIGITKDCGKQKQVKKENIYCNLKK